MALRELRNEEITAVSGGSISGWHDPLSFDAGGSAGPGRGTVTISNVDGSNATTYNYFSTFGSPYGGGGGGGSMALPAGFTPYSRGPGHPWDGTYAQGPDGNLYLTGEAYQAAVDFRGQMLDSAQQVSDAFLAMGIPGLFIPPAGVIAATGAVTTRGLQLGGGSPVPGPAR